MDIVSPKKRSKMMSAVRSANTRPELLVRKRLHRIGFRYKLNDASLPGKPDLVLPKYHAVVFVHGCFWHQHLNCKKSKIPLTRQSWWAKKLIGNVHRDSRIAEMLREMGWNVFIIWECELIKDSESTVGRLAQQLFSLVK